MTISSVTIKPVESLKNWYKLIFVSRRDGIGETTVEMLVSEETLRDIRHKASKFLPPEQSENEKPLFMREDK